MSAKFPRGGGGGGGAGPFLARSLIQQILQDIPICKNIVDDIIIYADNQEKHDKVLKMVLTRLREKNLTLNRDKCEFNKPSLIFISHVLSSEGIRISESKIHCSKHFKEHLIIFHR